MREWSGVKSGHGEMFEQFSHLMRVLLSECRRIQKKALDLTPILNYRVTGQGEQENWSTSPRYFGVPYDRILLGFWDRFV